MTDGWTWEKMTLKAPLSMIINWPYMRMADDDDEASKKRQE
jgi:hypothetical protein